MPPGCSFDVFRTPRSVVTTSWTFGHAIWNTARPALGGAAGGGIWIHEALGFKGDTEQTVDPPGEREPKLDVEQGASQQRSGDRTS